MADLVLLTMLVAAVLYTVLGGADFGAGITEAFVPRDERERVDAALAPVWEANHVWLVLIAVLAFVGFPSVYAVVSTYLHIPILLSLLGIVARGSAFTFRHYDPEPGRLTRWYGIAFRLGSVLTPLSLGLVIATTASGTLVAQPASGFYAAFIAPWNTWFAWSTALFVTALFTFEGAALLAAENAQRGGPLPYLRIARWSHVAAIACGGLVFVSAYVEHVPWLDAMLARPLSLGCMGLATVLIPVVARAFYTGRPWTVRLAVGAQVTAILVGFFAAQFPVLVRIEPASVTFPESAAPPATLAWLLVAVAVGLSLIVPSTVYLIRVYKRRDERNVEPPQAIQSGE